MRFYDNSMISTHRDCPRKFMFRYVYHLVRDFDMFDAEAVPAAVSGAHFGTSWHAAMDVVWEEIIAKQNASDAEVLKNAFVIWEHTWLKQIPEGAETGFRNKHTAIEMLSAYIKERRTWLARFKSLIATERPFAVPLVPDDKELWYCGRLDKLVEMNDDLIYVVDHKTTAQYDAKRKVRTSFLESFSPNSQIDGYSFGAMVLYGPKYGGAFIDGALVHKNERTFPLIPIARISDQLDAWLWETIHEVERIERYKEMLEARLNEPYLRAFPKNTGMCFQYGGPCAFLDLCRASANPQRLIEDTGTPGFKVEEWSPFKQYHLDQISVVEEKKHA